MPQSKQMSKKAVFKLALSINLILAILIGCASNPGGPLSLPTPYDVTPLTPTNTPCPGVQIDTSGYKESKPVFIVFAIKNDVFENQWTFESQSYGIVSKVLELAAEPGDSIVIFKLGPLEFKDALVFDGRVGNVFQPLIPPTLTAVPSITATNTPSQTLEPGIFVRQTEESAQQTQAVVEITATYIENLNRCGKDEWERLFSSSATQWAATRAAAKAGFDEELSAVATPAPFEVENKSRHVFEGLWHSSLAFESECKTQEYRRCLLILFSDLDDYRTKAPVYFDPPIDLENVEVLSVMLNCPVLFDPECQAVLDGWTDNFSLLGAKSSEFANADDIENKLIDFIRR